MPPHTPDERPLGADEDGSDDPHTVATSDAEMLDVVGPLLSFAHHIDIDIANVEDSHVVRHGVIDLRDGSARDAARRFRRHRRAPNHRARVARRIAW